MRTINECNKCFYQWFGIDPKRCAKCYSNKWNKELEGPTKMKDDEEWIQVNHHPYYKISNYGRIYSSITDKIITKSGASIVIINGHTKTITHLMLSTFKPDTWKSRRVRYIDGNNENIHIDNLEWY